MLCWCALSSSTIWNNHEQTGKTWLCLLKIIGHSPVRLHRDLKQSLLPIVFAPSPISHVNAKVQTLSSTTCSSSKDQQFHHSLAVLQECRSTWLRPSAPLDFCPSVYLLLARYNRDFCFPVRMHFLLLCTDAEETCSRILSALFHMLSELHVACNIFWPLQWLHGWIPFTEQNNWKS